MTRELQLKSELTSFLNAPLGTVDDLYDEVMQIQTHGLFLIEPRLQPRRHFDLGPQKPFDLNFPEDDRGTLIVVVNVLNDLIDQATTDSSINRIKLSLLSSLIEDHIHGSPLQDRMNSKWSSSLGERLNAFASYLNSVNWRSSFDLNESPSKITHWDHLLRSMAYIYPTGFLISPFAALIKKARESGLKSTVMLTPLLKARLLFEISLNDYLSVFPECDLDFIISFVFSKHVPHFPGETKAVESVKKALDEYSLMGPKFEDLISEIFTDYYYQDEEENETKAGILEAIGCKWASKIINMTYRPVLALEDYVIYPRASKLFAKLNSNLPSDVLFEHIANEVVLTLSQRAGFNASEVLFGFPNEELSKRTQEAYAYVLISILKCSEQTFNIVLKHFKKYAMATLPYFFGRFDSERYAILVTTHLYLILLSAEWITDDLEPYRQRLQRLVTLLNETVLIPYSYRLASYTMSFRPEGAARGDLNAFFVMMNQCARKDKLNIFSRIAAAIQMERPMRYPWLLMSVDASS